MEKLEVNCEDWRGAHVAALSRELLERAAVDCLRAAELRRPMVRGAKRAAALMDIILSTIVVD